MDRVKTDHGSMDSRIKLARPTSEKKTNRVNSYDDPLTELIAGPGALLLGPTHPRQFALVRKLTGIFREPPAV